MPREGAVDQPGGVQGSRGGRFPRPWLAVQARALAVLVLCHALNFHAHAAASFGTNLLVNGNAEDGPVEDASGPPPIPGWDTLGTAFSVAPYGLPDWPPNGSVPSGQANFFTGGRSNSQSAAQQAINVSNLAAAIDSGGVRCYFGGYFGGYMFQDDALTMQVTFQSSSQAAIFSSQQGGVLAVDRGSVTSFVGRWGNVSVPAGTRSILVRLSSARAAGTDNDGFADNLVVVLSSPTPPPSPPQPSRPPPSPPLSPPPRPPPPPPPRPPSLPLGKSLLLSIPLDQRWPETAGASSFMVANFSCRSLWFPLRVILSSLAVWHPAVHWLHRSQRTLILFWPFYVQALERKTTFTFASRCFLRFAYGQFVLSHLFMQHSPRLGHLLLQSSVQTCLSMGTPRLALAQTAHPLFLQSRAGTPRAPVSQLFNMDPRGDGLP